jgi:hypothetical protein
MRLRRRKRASSRRPSYRADIFRRWRRLERWLPPNNRKAINTSTQAMVGKFLSDCDLTPEDERNMRGISPCFSPGRWITNTCVAGEVKRRNYCNYFYCKTATSGNRLALSFDRRCLKNFEKNPNGNSGIRLELVCDERRAGSDRDVARSIDFPLERWDSTGVAIPRFSAIWQNRWN